MDEQFIQVLYSALGALGVKSKEEFEQGLQMLGEDGIALLYEQYQRDPKDVQSIAQMSAQIIQKKQQAVSAKLGAKLNYINSLRGRCPEGFEVEKFLAGGCVKCKKKLGEGGTAVERFKKSGTMPKKRISTTVEDHGDMVITTKHHPDGTTATRTVDETGTTKYKGRNGVTATEGNLSDYRDKKNKQKLDSLKKADGWKKCGGNMTKKKKVSKNQQGGFIEIPGYVSDYRKQFARYENIID